MGRAGQPRNGVRVRGPGDLRRGHVPRLPGARHTRLNLRLLALFLADLGRQPDTEGMAFRNALLYKPESKTPLAQVKKTLRYALSARVSYVAVIVFLLG